MKNITLLTGIIATLKSVPVWVWVVAALCIILPTLSYAAKRSIKIIGWVCLIAVCLFVFPSIGSAFMEQAGLTYDSETNVLTNKAGQSIAIDIPGLTEEQKSEATNTATDLVNMTQDLIKSFDVEDLRNGEVLTENVKEKAMELFGKYISDDEAKIIQQLLEFSAQEREE